MKKLKVIQFYTPNLTYAPTAEEINKNYCKLYSIDYFSQTSREVIDSKRDARAYCWYKILMVLEELEKDEYEYIMFVDADAVFVKTDYDVHDLIEKNSEYDLIISKDFGPDHVNTGVMIFKNTEWSKDFLRRIWEGGNQISRGRYRLEIWHEQTIMSAFLQINKYDAEKVKILSHYDYNSINDHILRVGETFIYHDLSKIRIQEIHKMILGSFDIFTELNLTCKSDRQVSHGYGAFYVRKIEEMLKTNDKVTVLDVGGDKGVLFEVITKYYPQVEYYNIVTDASYLIDENDRMNKIVLNEISDKTLQDFNDSNSLEYDIVIADYQHQCIFRDLIFSKFFDRIKSNGLFVVEDIQTDFEIDIPEKNERYNWGDPTKKSMTQLITQFNVDGTFNSDYWDFKNLNEKISKAEIHRCDPFPSLLGLIYKK